MEKKQLDPLVEIVQSQLEEIDAFKWIESEKVGHDIGWECAARDWSHKHFPAWKRHVWNRAVQDALRAEERGAAIPFSVLVCSIPAVSDFNPWLGGE